VLWLTADNHNAVTGQNCLQRSHASKATEKTILLEQLREKKVLT